MTSALLHLAQPATRRTVFVFAFTCLLLAACGSSNEATIDSTSSGFEPAPTAIATTPPLSLPPADDTLPAVAVLPPGNVIAAPTPAHEVPANPTGVTEATTESATTDSIPTPIPAAATEAAPATNPVPVAPVSEAAAPPSTPAAATEAAQAADPAVITAGDPSVVKSLALWSDCVAAAAQTTDAMVLLDPIAQGTTTDLTSVQLNALAAASISCDLVSTNLAATDLGDHVATAASCLNAWLESSGGGSVFVGLTSIGRKQPTPQWAQPHLVDALDSCFTGASFASDVLVVVSANPSLDGAFDASCLETPRIAH